jgi:hypothetical protein
VNENIEPLLIEQPLLNTNSTEDACICTNNTVVNIDLNESTLQVLCHFFLYL